MRALRLSLKLLAATLVAALTLASALWLWSGTDSSLAVLLTRMQNWLPAGQTLDAKDVQGSLRDGGHIGWLRWQQGDLSVQAQDIRVAWTLRPLLNQHLGLSELSIQALTITDQRSQTSTTPASPPTDLRLPISVQVPFKIASLTLTGATTLHASDLSGDYSFDSYSHLLSKGHGRISSGSYQVSGTLQASAPMALKLQLQGTLDTTLPTTQQPLTVNAQAQLTGELAGANALLSLQADLVPDLSPSASTRSVKHSPQARVNAQIAPWQPQPVTHAQAQWQALNLAGLWPQAPQTQLSGQASVTPTAKGWQCQVNLTNALPGPWNEQHLPVGSLQAEAQYNQGQWTLQSVQARAANGSVTGSGRWDGGQWRGSASLQAIDPAAIDTRLANGPLSGQVQAQQTASGIGFDVQLQADPTVHKWANTLQKSIRTLQLHSVQAQGQWAAPLLTLSRLHIQAQDAQLNGQLTYHTLTQASQGQLALQLPGLQGTVNGRLASGDGLGNLGVQVTDAVQATQWLNRFAPLAQALGPTQIKGSADLQVQWQGGWKTQGSALKIEAKLLAPKLQWQSLPNAQSSASNQGQLRALQADLSGTLANFRLQTQGQATIASRAIDWQAQVSGGQSETGHWQGRLNQLQIRTPDTQRSGSWLLQAVSTDRQPILLDWLTSSASQTFTVSAGSAKLHDPHASVANIDWQPAQWSAPRALSTQPSSAKAQWQSQGQITDLPLTWLVPLGKKSLADLGLSSDLILSGNWDAKQSDSVHLSAMLERSSGDLRLSTEAQAGRTVALPANMQEARLNVNLDGDRVSGSLRWDSERVGRALMAFSTQLQATDQGWTLPANAPVGASLQMQMPPLDAWSVLAPPGWRLRGTMTSDISLTGTLDKPEWSGSLQARDLAVRSVVDGIDFNHGSLNARLHGQQLDINNFSLQGASTSTGTQGGQVDLQGSVKWLADSAAPQWASRLSMALDVQAKALRLSSRSDRRVTVSGKLDAQLKDARLTLRGTLTADQALITLPDDDAPRLGDDVVVRRAGNAATPMPPAARPNPDKTTSTTLRIVPDVLLNLDLGPDFQVRGRGLDTRLTGKLELRALDQNTPTLIGTIRTQRGTYRAYGQRLDIEQGVLRFVGPVDNPALNILAIRPKLSQKVGVQILGSAQSPIVRLYADPEMSEADKLAWLVLGRSASDSGGESALLQQAALALLGGSGQGPSASLTQALGLDELSFRSATGETTSGATVTLGKRLSNDFYVAYESGLAGSMGVFTIFYDLSKTLTLRAQTGEQSTVDLIWTYRYD